MVYWVQALLEEGGRRRMKSSSCALVALVLALIVGGALYFYSQKNTDQKKETKSEQPTLSEQSNEETDNLSVLEPEKVELTATSGEGHAVANRIFSEKQFIHTITAQLPDLKDNQYYAGWLGQKNGDKETFVSTGNFEANGEDFYLEFRDSKDLSAYKHVAVSLEDKPVTQPTTIILEGNFK